MTDIDYIVSFSIFIIVFITFFYIFSNLLETKSEYTRDISIEYELNTIKNTIKQTSLFENFSYARIKISETSGQQHYENISILLKYNKNPENLKIYDNRFTVIPFIYENNILNISINIYENQEKYFFLIWTNNAKITQFECIDCNNKFLSSKIIFCDDCFLKIANFEKFNYTKIKEELNTNYNFNMEIKNNTYGPSSYKIKHYKTIDIFYINGNFEIKNEIIKIGVW